eukprot:TRINITY_DN198_c0_g2_i1.p1 TRINITY_DN198_c0_g2~~TRINITY_DN198_c0_g2_i1.p1  ORF type:complete len:268 (+),score=54.92 TRINITY_DN198_c0_g2_i1:275-1078(+)
MLKLLPSTPPDDRNHWGNHRYHPHNYNHHNKMTISLVDILNSDELRISAFPASTDWATACEDESEEEDEVQEPPFWFSFEEPEHVKEIISEYSKYLKMDAEAETRVRQGKPFIGCIKRTFVKSQDSKAFRTLDRIYICRREDVAPGKTLPLERKVYVVTKWDVEDGLPLKFVRCASPKKRNLWKSKRLPHTSFLYCMPKLLAKATNEDKRLLYLPTDNFFASNEKLPLTNARTTSWTVFDDVLLKCDLQKDGDEEQDEPDSDSDCFI